MNKNVTRRQLTVAGLGAAAVLGLGRSAHATACPPDKVRLDGSGQKPGATMPKDVTDSVIASMVEETEVGVNDRLFRLRRLEIKPGGEVPWHSHADRPAIIYIVQGSITEYRSTCRDPLVHKAGDAITKTTSCPTGGRTRAKRQRSCCPRTFSTQPILIRT